MAMVTQGLSISATHVGTDIVMDWEGAGKLYHISTGLSSI